MSFHLAHIHEYSRFLAIDIGSYKIRTSVYSVEKLSLNEISYASIRQNRKNFVGGQISDMRGVAKTIEQSILQATQNVKHIPDDVIISFSSSDFFFDSITTQYVRIDPSSTLTMQELDTMIKKIESASHARAREKVKNRLGVLSDDLRLVSSTITSIEIDGKKITNPVGFSGGKVVLTVLNVFAPASEFNILRSIIASLGRKAISLIPTPLLFPKLIEQTEYIHDKNCYVDIGYTHTTVLISDDNEIKTFETFPFWARMLMEMIRDVDREISLLGIENILCHKEKIAETKYSEILSDFFEYIFDMMLAFLEEENIDIKIENIFLHGNIFKNEKIFSEFARGFADRTGYESNTEYLCDMLPEGIEHDEALTHALALTASELLLVKKDPLIRILRYVLYNYE